MDSVTGRTLPGDHRQLVIVGGGVYGAATLLEACRHGMTALLLEQHRLGSGVSAGNFRTLHGGLRSLQSLDFTRFFESVRERRWYLRHFAQLTAPLRFVMPLDGRGYRQPMVMGTAGAVNDALGMARNRGVAQHLHVPRSQLIDSSVCRDLLRGLSMNCRKGGFIWYDAEVTDFAGLLEAMVYSAETSGGAVAEHQRVLSVRMGSGRVHIQTADQRSGEVAQLTADSVVFACGPWPSVADQLPPLTGHHPSLAFNLVFRREALSSDAIAVRTRFGHTYFVRSFGGAMYLGTRHVPLLNSNKMKAPELWSAQYFHELAASHVSAFLNEINQAAGLDLGADEVVQIQAGILPVVHPGETRLSVRPRTVATNDTRILRISGVKFTTARDVAERVIRRILRARRLGYRPVPYPTFIMQVPVNRRVTLGDGSV